jgi:hypothetical protein
MNFLIKLIRNETKLTLSATLSFIGLLYFFQFYPNVDFTAQVVVITFFTNTLVYFGIFSVVELKLQLIYKIILAIFILAIPLFSGFKLDYIMAFISSVLIWVYTLKIVPQLHDIENESNLLVSINNKLDLLLEKNGKQPLK